MRALQLFQSGVEPVLTDVDDPVAGAGLMVAPVVVAGLHSHDIAVADGIAEHPRLPAVLGDEAVVRINDELRWYERTGQSQGALAEQTVVAADSGVRLPENLDPADALSIGAVGVGAWLALVQVGAMSPGETVIVLGATGPAGQIAVQAAKLLGAARVVAVGRHEPTLDLLSRRGADEVVTLDQASSANLLDLTRGGADLVWDCLYGEPLSAALNATKPFGRSVTIAAKAGNTLSLPIGAFFRRRLLTSSIRVADGSVKRSVFLRMADHVLAGELMPNVQTLPLADVESGWRRQRAFPHRKLVITP